MKYDETIYPHVGFRLPPCVSAVPRRHMMTTMIAAVAKLTRSPGMIATACLMGLTSLPAQMSHAASGETPFSSTQMWARQAKVDDAEQIDISVAIRRALTKGPRMALAQLDRRSAQLSLDAGLTLYDPKVSISGSQSSTRTQDAFRRSASGRAGEVGINATLKTSLGTDIRVVITRPLYARSSDLDGGRASIEASQPLLRGAGREVAGLNYQQLMLQKRSDDRSLNTARRDVIGEVFGAFFAAYQAAQGLNITRAGLVRANESERLSQVLLKAGRMARMDTVQAQADVSRAALEVEGAEATHADAQRRLALVLGDAENAQYKIDASMRDIDPPVSDVTQALAIAYAERTDFAEGDDQLTQRRMTLLRAKDDLLPRLDVSVRHERGIGRISGSGEVLPETHPQSTAVALTLELALTRTEQLAARDAAVIGLERMRLELEELKRGITSQVLSALDGLASAHRSQALANASLELQKMRLSAETEKFKSGRTSSNQLSETQTAVLEAERANLQASLDIIRSQFEVDNATGRTLKTWAPWLGSTGP